MIDPTFPGPAALGRPSKRRCSTATYSTFPLQNVVPELEREAREAKLEALKCKRLAVEEWHQWEREAQKKLRQIGYCCMGILIDQARTLPMASNASPPRRTSRSEGLAQPVTQKSAATKRTMQRLHNGCGLPRLQPPLPHRMLPNARRIAIAYRFLK